MRTTITPENATTMLAASEAAGYTNYRIRLVEVTVARYAADMAVGNWPWTGEPILIGPNGEVIDGQHRLHACVRSGASFECEVVYGVPLNVAKYVDTGMGRSLHVVLRQMEVAHPTIVAGATRLCWRWNTNGRIIHARRAPSHAEALRWLDRNPGIHDVLPLAFRLNSTWKVAPSVAAAFNYRLRKACAGDPLEADAFIKAVIGSPDQAPGPAAHHLQNWLRTQVVERSAGRKPASFVVMAHMIKAWNYWITGTEIQYFRWRQGGSSPEGFPAILTDDDPPQPADFNEPE